MVTHIIRSAPLLDGSGTTVIQLHPPNAPDAPDPRIPAERIPAERIPETYRNILIAAVDTAWAAGHDAGTGEDFPLTTDEIILSLIPLVREQNTIRRQRIATQTARLAALERRALFMLSCCEVRFNDIEIESWEHLDAIMEHLDKGGDGHVDGYVCHGRGEEDARRAPWLEER